ncbi:RdgB/HAM1 family non-canonical purine NTP pyrophosphatase [Gulosibacter macacae]|uniref:dITP/XTP pyrophosphatase n=1 Tax=Gulosibacter macacae TaxID=2488791 RepID=A0A3P3W1F8_9MICO|nr:RdgB/HAM1 family non-canonical purine NTP pyrophosphatase [Gulosibacter macacae]RRJ88855.1 RdgB/HAM1 family non-canonical purine NTP pyrophosphatase [Gulosibacter macacae]
MQQIVLASRNAHKLEELRRILAPTLGEIELVGDDGPGPVENGVTFEANALIKARAAAQRTGLPALADDSGIAVDVLGGSPGIFSARWAGPQRSDADNLDLLLWQLSDVADEHRGAKFVAAAALVMPDGREVAVRGEWPGSILRERRGAGGFGYDPIFLPEGSERAAAELDAAEKDALSHRRRAFEALAPHLQAWLVE